MYFVCIHPFQDGNGRIGRALAEKSLAEYHGEPTLIALSQTIERNRDMALLFPEKAKLLTELNERMVDLEDVFKSDYVDARFDGLTSIKKVLPVICPELSYKELDVQDGASAMEAWQRMIEADKAEADEIAEALLSYCKLDTLAMVDIYRFLAAQCQ